MAKQQEIQQQDHNILSLILRQYSFFNAFIGTADVPEISMRQFWYTVTYNLEAKTYFFTLDDKSFKVNADLLRDALHITSKDSDHPFVTPPPHDEIEMLSDEIKASVDYLNYLAKSMGTQPAKGQGQGLLTKKVIEETGKSEEVANTVDSEEIDEDEVHPNERQTSIIIGRGQLQKQAKIQQHSKGLCEGSGVISEVPDGPSDRSDSSIVDSEKAEDVKDATEQPGEEQAMDEQARIDQPGKVQVEVSVPDPQVEKPTTQLLSTNLVEIEILSMVDVPIYQEYPAVQRPRLVDTVISIIPEKKIASPKQQLPQTQLKQSKTKLILKKSKKPEKQVDDDVILKRVTRLEKKVEAMSKIDHS
ncbi:hypothetical protein Tco_1415426 [Tanacetum coccineum]